MPLKSGSWILRLNAVSKPAARLFCFPFAGGGGSVFRPWIRLLPSDIEVFSVQFPGRESRTGECPFNRILPLAMAAADALLPQMGRPCAFLGCSMGAIVGFEVARRLQGMGCSRPFLLIACASPAPQLDRRHPITFNLPDDQLSHYLREMGGTPPAALEDSALMNVLLPLIRADFEALETYVYKSGLPLECPIIAVGGSDDPEIAVAALQAWKIQTRSEFSCCVAPGNHFFLFNSSSSSVVRTLLSYVRRYIPYY
jgi:medium-chain acyl-[acyl-carrier-protein] hydrolase